MNEAVACSDARVASLSNTKPTAAGERLSMDETLVTDAHNRLVAWLDEGQYMLGRIVPALLEERDALRTRAIESERRTEELEVQVATLQQQLRDLRDKHQQLQFGQTEIVQSVSKFLGHMTGLLEPMKDLAEKIEHTQTA